MIGITEERVAELETRARHHEDGARSPAGCLARAVLELAAAVRAEPVPAAPAGFVELPSAKWAAERPTASGHYWFRASAAGAADIVAVAEVDPGVLWAGAAGVAAAPLAEWPEGLWCGPIAAPEPIDGGKDADSYKLNPGGQRS